MPYQSLEDMADDLMLMNDLKINWAPIIPYMHIPNAPLADEGGRGSVDIMIKVISILRLMIPHVDITGQQPGEDIKKVWQIFGAI